MMKDKIKKNSLEQFAQLPQKVQKVCVNAVKIRYDKHYHPKNDHHRKHMAVDFLLGGLVLFLIAFSFYVFAFYSGAVLREKITLNVSTSDHIVISGGEVEIDINIENNTGQSLSDTYLELPRGAEFVPSSSSSHTMEGNIIRLGTLDNKESVRVSASGYIIADIDKSVRISAILNYTSNSVLGADQKLGSEIVEIFGSSLAVDLNLPESIAANQPFDFEINYHNESTITGFGQIGIYASWPPGWEIIESAPELTEGADFWSIDSIGSLEKGQIVGRAQLIASDLEYADIELKTFTAPYGTPYLQDQQKFHVSVTYPNVKVKASVNKSIANLGDTLGYTITVNNLEDFEISEIKARFNPSSAIFNLSNLDATLLDDGKYEVVLSELIAPNQSHEFIQSLVLRQQVNPSIAFGQGQAQVSLPFEIVYFDNHGQLVTIPIEPTVTLLNSDLSLDSFARYYSAEGDQIGRGPVSPIVGETTKYWVFLHVTNNLHALRSVILTASIPAGVDWTGKVSVTNGGAMTFNEGSRVLTWPVGDVANYKTNYDQSGYGAAFEIAVTPALEQKGSNVSLLNNIRVEGVDSLTGNIVRDQVDVVVNDLNRDSYAGSDGKVTL